ncbi:TPA: hypothetical protein DCP42_03565 [Patescibacteria group bacterium]|nr:hypothetical protein [Patescibacteria group bacterium]
MSQFEPTDDTKAELTTEVLTISDFENLNIPELLPYQGEGKTSFKAEDKGINYDEQKEEYLHTLGIDIPDTWKAESGKIETDSRALFITTFVVTGHILATEAMRRTIVDDPNYETIFTEVLNDRNNQILEHRLDESGMRKMLPNKTRVESYYEALGLSSNPEKRVSREELREVVKYIFFHLRKNQYADSKEE